MDILKDKGGRPSENRKIEKRVNKQDKFRTKRKSRRGRERRGRQRKRREEREKENVSERLKRGDRDT